MSRNYKRRPYLKDGGPVRRRFAKNYANRKVRKTDDVPDGKAYRKVSETWDINDYSWRHTFGQWMTHAESVYLQYVNGSSYYYSWEKWKKKETISPPDIQEEWNEYRKSYYWK